VLSAALLFATVSARPAEFYVAPEGKAAGSGAKMSPCDLGTALSGALGKPGDTFWLRGGTHRIGHVDTQIHGAPAKPITFRQMPGERARVVGSLTVWGEGGYLIFRDFELSSGDTNRLSKQTGMGFHPTDITNHSGVQSYAPNCSFLNLVVHDAVGSGFYTSSAATNTVIYGCIVYNCGWACPDDAEGHSYYLQGPGELADNLGFNSTGASFHIYSSGSDGYLRNMTLDGNVGFGAGALQRVRKYRDWVVGVDAPGKPARKTNGFVPTNNVASHEVAEELSLPLMATDISLKNNMGYLTENPTTLTQVQIGREQINGRITLSSNYWPLGVVINNWRAASVTGNLFAPRNSDYILDLQETLVTPKATWDHNVYARSAGEDSFRINSKACDFSSWKAITGWDAHSSCAARLSGLKVFVRPNRYEKGRAHITIYNWEKLGTVAVDVSCVLPVGAHYEVRNAQDFYAAPVVSGVFDGQPLHLPMTGLTVAAPLGPFLAPAPTGPTFQVFVLLPVP
jgi:hypothetical protein